MFVDGMASTNGIESVWAVLKRMFYGTYHQFSRKHLQRYVDECTFRLNQGNCKIHVLDRMNSSIIGGFIQIFNIFLIRTFNKIHIRCYRN